MKERIESRVDIGDLYVYNLLTSGSGPILQLSFTRTSTARGCDCHISQSMIREELCSFFLEGLFGASDLHG